MIRHGLFFYEPTSLSRLFVLPFPLTKLIKIVYPYLVYCGNGFLPCCFNLRACLYVVPMYVSARSLDSLARTKSPGSESKTL